ncbi:hypothetical protein AVEN_203841-1 [Araneus ventricosus]|uniref:Uncharacterized protein n=1 Tax=Araneus ventricosus TaxID=182803 RepID=A0A4Y2WUN0_ARAVE|nr:hypothetical protein AVEN_94207-1 [Araneus ventricosus]GBO41185.1 hypothetical protein AVEN_203841-1 [Araneus ventricosus]
MVHVTGPLRVASSKKKGPIMNVAVNPHQTFGDEDDDSDDINDRSYRGSLRSEQSHLIVWQIPLPSTTPGHMQ